MNDGNFSSDESESGPGDAPDARSQRVERLFREHNEALIRFLMSRMRSYHEAREVAQEAYVRLLSLDDTGAVSYLRAFLFKTAANIAIDRQRRDHSYGRVDELPLFQELTEQRTPERRVAGEQTLARLQRLIAALPAKCREAFVLHQFHNMSPAQIAQQMRVSERMVRKYIVRALAHCRAGLDSTGGSGND
ncbi:RNA polymerase sigma factor [Peristeroidobacter soli]|uniref:RNA polymerase sigma factor n=1 Tax=Peristeroidobacter soli TaxID=2497877 RepID=UPI00101E0A0A|nr:RNA polymerase sigma factor [Peristeroidobacter soli]